MATFGRLHRSSGYIDLNEFVRHSDFVHHSEHTFEIDHTRSQFHHPRHDRYGESSQALTNWQCWIEVFQADSNHSVTIVEQILDRVDLCAGQPSNVEFYLYQLRIRLLHQEVECQRTSRLLQGGKLHLMIVIGETKPILFALSSQFVQTVG